MAERKLYLDGWNYNKSVLADMLEKYVTENGGKLLGYYKPGVIVRTNHSTGETFGETETNHCDVFGTSVSFILNGEYFSVSLDDNPFFEFYYSRIPVREDGTYIGEYYGENLSHDWVYNCIMSHQITEKELNIVFEEFKNALFNAKRSQRVHHKKKICVPNLYDGRTHYEWVDNSDNKVKTPTERKECTW